MTGSLLLALVGLALFDSVNPSLFIAQFYLITTPRPIPRLLSYIAGVVVANIAGGVLLLSGAQAFLVGLISQMDAATLNWAKLVLGLALLLFGLLFRIMKAQHTTAKQPRSLHPLHTFALGIVVMVNELTTALPYFVAIERIAQAQLDTVSNLLLLVLYNTLFAAPLFGFVILFLAFRERFTARLDQLSQAVSYWTPRLVKYGSILFGGVLMVDATWRILTEAKLF